MDKLEIVAVAERVKRGTRSADILALCDAVLLGIASGCPACERRRKENLRRVNAWRDKKKRNITA
jgi:hypothetical protein